MTEKIKTRQTAEETSAVESGLLADTGSAGNGKSLGPKTAF